MKYIIWVNNHTEGWAPHEAETLADCYAHALDTCSRDFIITKQVFVELRELEATNPPVPAQEKQ